MRLPPLFRWWQCYCRNNIQPSSHFCFRMEIMGHPPFREPGNADPASGSSEADGTVEFMLHIPSREAYRADSAGGSRKSHCLAEIVNHFPLRQTNGTDPASRGEQTELIVDGRGAHR